MLKKKLHFKEDKSHLNCMKYENDKIINNIQPLEDLKKIRGRQLNVKTYNSNQKNLVTCIKNKNEKCQNRSLVEFEEDKGKNKYYIKKIQKIKGLNSKSYRADSIDIEEDYYSSNSDCSIRNNKKRELLDENSELPEKFKYYYRNNSLNNSEEIIEICEQSDDLAFTYGENNLTNEVEKILIDIYNNHVYINPRNKIDISQYEKHIKFYSKNLNKHFNLYILQIMSDKIKELIHRYKEKIFEIPEIKQIRDRYYEIKASLMGEKIRSEATNNEKKVSLDNGNYRIRENIPNDKEIFQKTSHLNCNCLKNAQSDNINCNYNSECANYQTHDLRFNDSDKSVTKIILLELKKIKKLLIDSCKDIQKVFRLPLSHLKLNNKIVDFNLEDIHREQFNNTLLKDEFIEALIIQIKTIARELKIEDIHNLLAQIEEEKSSKNNEMTRFTAFLFSQLNSSIDNEYGQEEISERSKSDSSQKSDTNNLQTNTLSQVNSNSKYYTTNNTSFDLCYNSSSPSNKVSDEIGIDELVEFIQKPETKKIKKNRKKKKCVKKIEPQVQIIECVGAVDEEVEKFKKLINEGTSRLNSIKKIKPTISKEWLSSISKIINA